MASTLSELIKDIVRYAAAYQDGSGADKQQLMKAANRLITELESPMDQVNKIIWGDPSRTAALKIAIDVGCLKKLNHERPMSSAQLAEDTPASSALVGRIMKILSAYNLVEEVGKDQYKATPFSLAVANDTPELAGLEVGFTTTIAGVDATPEFLSKIKFQLPDGEPKTPFQFSLKTDQTFFEYLAANPRISEAFNKYMIGYTATDSSWVDTYPCAERLSVTSKDDIVLVDVGGGLGHQIAKFHTKHPATPGRLVLQDLPAALVDLKGPHALPSTIEPVEHDFFTPQPTRYKGAKAYYLRHILHDWPDDKCKIILSHLRDAMTPGYSKLIVDETVLEDVSSPWRQVCIDWLMMSMFNAKERTESEWHVLFESVGLKVAGVWRAAIGDHGVIEAVLADD